MKVLYDYQVFSWQQYGGISRYFYEISNRIAAVKGNDVEIFAPLYFTACFRADSVVRPVGIKLPHPKLMIPVVTRFDRVVSQLAKPFRRNVDVFHETYYSMTDCCPRSAIRVITVLDMIHERFAAMFPRWDRTPQIKAHAVRRADHIICISENTRRDLIELLGVPERKISVVYLGHALTARQAAVIPSVIRKPYVLYVGLRGGYKNFETMLRAFAASSLLRQDFSIVCFGGGAATTGELALAKSLGLAPNTVAYVAGSDEVLAGLYASAAVFVYPSLYEGFGIPPLEAMAAGCPVACAGTSSLPEVVGDAAELFDPTDEADMRGAIERVVSDPERAKLLVARGHERIKRFSWEKCAQETLDVYTAALQEKAK